jgi:cyclophilin family peptidyl-prolyl cis-trans isomerase
MAVKETDAAKGAEPASVGDRASAWISRVNEFGERHATAIIAVSTVLTILTVILFATYFYNRAQNERAEQELGEATLIEKLRELKTKYGTTPSAPRIVYKLANQLYEEGKLEEAKKEYAEFQSRFPLDPLRERATAALRSLDTNQKFQQDDRERKLKEPKLQTHPRMLADAKDPRFQFGPSNQPRPTVELEVGIGTTKVILELFEDEAPKSVAAFLKWIDDKHFDGIKLDTVNTDERLATVLKPADAVPYEATPRPADAYSLILVRDADVSRNVGGQFQVLLKDLPDLKDITIFGTVREGAPILRALKKDDVIKSAKVVTRRGEAKAQTPNPKPQ